MNDIVTWPQHVGYIHGQLVVGYDTVPTSSLAGYKLDYVLAAACKVSQIKLQYYPGLRSAQVSILDSTREKEFIAWSPTNDSVQAELVLKKLNCDFTDTSPDRLLSAAMMIYPETVNIPVPKQRI